MTIVEAAVETVDAAIGAERAGAQRVELCVQLDKGGTTPPAELIRRVESAVSLPVFVLVRPRTGDFVYSDEEVEVMRRDISVAIAAGAGGIVTGALTATGRTAFDAMRMFISAAAGTPVTYHRAFDVARDFSEALDDAITLGVSRVLTSGGAATAVDGAVTIARLVKQAGHRIVIMAGGAIRDHNVRALIDQTAVNEIHSRMIDEPGMTRLVAEVRRTTSSRGVHNSVANG